MCKHRLYSKSDLIHMSFKTDLHAEHKKYKGLHQDLLIHVKASLLFKVWKMIIYLWPADWSCFWISKSSGEEQPNCIITESEMAVNFPHLAFLLQFVKWRCHTLVEFTNTLMNEVFSQQTRYQYKQWIRNDGPSILSPSNRSLPWDYSLYIRST